jgi:hypothetical protein
LNDDCVFNRIKVSTLDIHASTRPACVDGKRDKAVLNNDSDTENAFTSGDIGTLAVIAQDILVGVESGMVQTSWVSFQKRPRTTESTHPS